MCKRNAAAVTKAAPASARPTVEVRAVAAQAYLAGASGPFDLVFIDPPYDVDDAELLGVLTAVVPLLAPHASVCVERSTRTGEPTLPDGLALVRRKDYGETALFWLEPSGA